MRIVGIKIDNYKSFGENNNILRFDSEDTIALIGKNETGKSNTLMAIKDLSFFESNIRTNIFENQNRINNNEVLISIDIEFNEDEFSDKKEFIKDYKSRFVFCKKYGYIDMSFDGCISNILESDTQLLDLSEQISKFPTKYQQEKNAAILKEKIKNYTNRYINLSNIANVLNIDGERKTIYEQFKNLLDEYYSYFRKILPKIIYFSNNMVLKNQYSYDSIIKNEDINGLNYLLEALNFSMDDLKIWLTSKDGAIKQKNSVKFQNELNKFNQEFQKYYKTNKIELLCNVDSKNIEFSVRDDLEDDGTSITTFSERSDGLKWYLSMFIQLYFSRKKYKYSLILVDEPGNSLHVIAQKKLLELLMITKDYQIIYTTHSPYMIDSEHLENIRLIIKDKFTNIINGLNNAHRKGKISFKETLTPVLEAIGLSLNYNFGPSSTKLNLIVEGISDYLYIKSMFNVLNIRDDKRPNIIPCVGVANESNIASILLGWGYKFKCVFDNDKEGIKTYNELKKYLDNYKEILYFISDNNGYTIENLLSNRIKEKIESGSKTLNAKKFSAMTDKGELEVDKETKQRFATFFKKLKIIN